MSKKNLFFIVLIFTVIGFLIGKIVYGKNEATKIAYFGVPTYENREDAISYFYEVNDIDKEDESTINNLLMILIGYSELTKKPVETRRIPDGFLRIISTRNHVVLVDEMIWFIKDGAYIGHREYGVKKLNKEDAKYLKRFMKKNTIQ